MWRILCTLFLISHESHLSGGAIRHEGVLSEGSELLRGLRLVVLLNRSPLLLRLNLSKEERSMVGVGAIAGSMLFDFVKGVGTSVAPDVMTVISGFLKKKLGNLNEKLSEPAQEAVKGTGGPGGNEVPPVEVLDELRKYVGELLKEQASPVYAYCVIFFIDGVMGSEEQELVRNIITGAFKWDDEPSQEKQAFVDKFMEAYIGGTPSIGEDYEVSDKYITLNFSDFDCHVYCEEDMRDLADALNHFLGDRYITSFSIS